MKTYYLRIEAVNLDYSVYDTHDISTIRGGSFMLLDVVEKLGNMKINGTVLEDIGSAASIGLYKFHAKNESDAESIKEQALSILKEKTGDFATFVSSIKPAGSPEDFQNVLQWLTSNSLWQQYQQPTLVLPEELPKKFSKNQECSFDGVRPAVETIIKGKELKPASKAVYTRYEQGRKLRNNLYFDLLKESDVKITVEKDGLCTNDLEALSIREGSLSGKIAFIHLDGNRFGKIRDTHCRFEKDYQEFQKLLKNTRLAALKRILVSAQNSRTFHTTKGEIRLETLMWGGDEIEFVVPAWQALNVLKDFFTEILKAEPFKKVPLTYSAGVLFCHHNLPILQVRRYAEQLCSLAKNEVIVPKNISELKTSHNYFAFLDMSAFDLVKGDVKKFLAQYYTPAKPEDFVISANELDDLMERLLIIKGHFPKNKLYDIILALKENKPDEVEKIKERASELIKDHKEQVEKAIEDILAGNNNRWYLISDLLPYVGEDDHE